MNTLIPSMMPDTEISHTEFPEGVDESGEELSLTVSPRVLSISNPGETRADMRVSNSSAFPVYFKVLTTNKEAMRVVPSCGVLAPGEETCIRVYRAPSSWPIRPHEEILVMTSPTATSFQKQKEWNFAASEDHVQDCEFCSTEETLPSGHVTVNLKNLLLDMLNSASDPATPPASGVRQRTACSHTVCLCQTHNCSDVRHKCKAHAHHRYTDFADHDRHQCPARSDDPASSDVLLQSQAHPYAYRQCPAYSNEGQQRCQAHFIEGQQPCPAHSNEGQQRCQTNFNEGQQPCSAYSNVGQQRCQAHFNEGQQPCPAHSNEGQQRCQAHFNERLQPCPALSNEGQQRCQAHFKEGQQPCLAHSNVGQQRCPAHTEARQKYPAHYSKGQQCCQAISHKIQQPCPELSNDGQHQCTSRRHCPGYFNEGHQRCTYEEHFMAIQGEAMMPQDSDSSTSSLLGGSACTLTIVQAWILVCIVLTIVLVALASTCCVFQLRRPLHCLSTNKPCFVDYLTWLKKMFVYPRI